jgi:hypothetical protein
MLRATLHAVLLVAVGALLSCSRDLVTPSTHVLIGNAYDPGNRCLNPQQSFDVVDGPAADGTCDVVCITDAKTGTAYVTNACPPYPVLDTVESDGGEGGADPCTAALAAWAAGNECGASSEASADDASGDDASAAGEGSAGATDASTDAGGDAS